MQDPAAAPVTAAAPIAQPEAQPVAATTPPQAMTEDTWTRRVMVLASLIVVGLSVMTIVGVMAYRVVLDGNSSLTNDITSKLMWIALMGIGSMLAALFGSNSLISKAIDKLV